LTKDLSITHSCLIEKNKVILNGRDVFNSQGMDLSAFLLALYKHAGINYPKFYKMDNLSKLGFLAAEMILKNPTLILDFKKEDIAIVLYNRNSSLDTDINYFETVKEMASPALFVYTLPNILIGELCIRHGFKGENIFFLSETFKAEEMMDYVTFLLENNLAKACLCGWVDCFEEDYKACLMWVENSEQGEYFTADTINKIYNQGNG